MKKKLLLVAMMSAALLTGCGNKDMLDFNYTYDRAIIQLVNGEVVEVEIDKWTDYDGEQLQIISKDGTIYLTSSFRCDLIRDK